MILQASINYKSIWGIKRSQSFKSSIIFQPRTCLLWVSWWSIVIIVSEFSVKPSAALLIKILLQRGCCDEHKSVAEKDGGVGEDRLKSRPHLPKGWYAFDDSVWVSHFKTSGKKCGFNIEYQTMKRPTCSGNDKCNQVYTCLVTYFVTGATASIPGITSSRCSSGHWSPQRRLRRGSSNGLKAGGWSCRWKITHLHR